MPKRDNMPKFMYLIINHLVILGTLCCLGTLLSLGTKVKVKIS